MSVSLDFLTVLSRIRASVELGWRYGGGQLASGRAQEDSEVVSIREGPVWRKIGSIGWTAKR